MIWRLTAVAPGRGGQARTTTPSVARHPPQRTRGRSKSLFVRAWLRKEREAKKCPTPCYRRHMGGVGGATSRTRRPGTLQTRLTHTHDRPKVRNLRAGRLPSRDIRIIPRRMVAQNRQPRVSRIVHSGGTRTCGGRVACDEAAPLLPPCRLAALRACVCAGVYCERLSPGRSGHAERLNLCTFLRLLAIARCSRLANSTWHIAGRSCMGGYVPGGVAHFLKSKTPSSSSAKAQVEISTPLPDKKATRRP